MASASPQQPEARETAADEEEAEPESLTVSCHTLLAMSPRHHFLTCCSVIIRLVSAKPALLLEEA